jgi:hypothetical protein
MSSMKHTTTTRRAFMASVPLAAATLTPAAATALGGLVPQTAGTSSVDPIYATIERCRAATVAYDSAYSNADRIENEVQNDWTRPDYEEACGALDAALKALNDTHDTLFATEPTTVAGLHAFLDYSDEVGERLWDNWEVDAFATVAAAVRSLTLPAIEARAQS